MNKYTNSSGAKYNGRKGIDYEVPYKDENGEWREMPDPFDEENNENKK